MGERIAWMMSSRSDTFAINLKYTDIETQKISSEGKAKIQLQVCFRCLHHIFSVNKL